MLPTVEQYNTTLQSYRNLDIKIEVLDFNLDMIDEISGLVTQVDISVDADSDIRRTANISMVLKSDFTRTSSVGAGFQSHDMYWTAGNSYWFDKFIKIYIAIQDISTQEFEWVNQGVYMLNSPSVSYDATTNNLSFQAVDMMAKLTGMRNGYLAGVPYQIDVKSSIVSVMESVLRMAGITKYILYTPPTQVTPYDIKMDIGATVYELLSELRDINANWEMFFDEEGTFIFQSIPTGNAVDPNTGQSTMLSPLVTPKVWDRVQSSYDLTTNFEEIKNYIEVLGRTHESGAVATNVTTSGNTLSCKVDFNITTSDIRVVLIPWGITDLTKLPIRLSSELTRISITDTSGNTVNISDNVSILYSNTYYTVSLGNRSGEFLGGVQAHAIVWENNPDSPFYVGKYAPYQYGDSIRTYISSYCDPVYHNPVRTNERLLDPDYVGSGGMIITPTVTSNSMTLELNNIITESMFTMAAVNSGWDIVVHTPSLSVPITSCTIKYGNSRTSSPVMDTFNYTNDTRTSLELSNVRYIFTVVKKSSSTISLSISFPPVEASMVPKNYTYDVIQPPTFEKQVRYICSGDEYDNVMSDSLARERGRYELYLRARLHDSIDIETVPIYWLGVNEIVQYNVLNEKSESGELEPSYWLVKSINTSLSANGTQSVSAIRYYPLYPSN